MELIAPDKNDTEIHLTRVKGMLTEIFLNRIEITIKTDKK